MFNFINNAKEIVIKEVLELKYHYNLWDSLAKYAIENFKKDKKFSDKMEDLDYMIWCWRTSKKTLEEYQEFYEDVHRINNDMKNGTPVPGIYINGLDTDGDDPVAIAQRLSIAKINTKRLHQL